MAVPVKLFNPATTIFLFANKIMENDDEFENFSENLRCNVGLAASNELSLSKHTACRSFEDTVWKHFSNGAVNIPRDGTLQRIETIEQHYRNFPQHYSASDAADKKWFEFDLQLAENDLYVRDRWSTFRHDFLKHPEQTIACIGLAMVRHTGKCRIVPRFKYFGQETRVSHIDRSHIGKLVTIRGTVVRETFHHVSDESDTPSSRVITVHQTGKTCKIASESVDVHLPIVFEPSLFIGDIVAISGIVKQQPFDDMKKARSAPSTIFLLAICIRSLKNDPPADGPMLKISPFDMEVVRAIREEPFSFKLLVQSLCPTLPGFETIKAGLLLALFSSGEDVHVLLVGSEKSLNQKLLKSCAAVSPRGILVEDSFETMGLQETDDAAVRSLIAGPLVLADLDVCCIDEIEKLLHLESLLSIMHDREVQVHHDALSASRFPKVPVRSTVIAGTCPKGGIFDSSKHFFANISLPRTIVAEFPLVFTMTDTVDVDEQLVCPNGVRLHPELKSTNKCSVEVPLVKQLKCQREESMDVLPVELMSKYIEYARFHCAPAFTESSSALLENFFIQMHSMPPWLNWRSETIVNSIRTMACARARIDLCDEITYDHVMETIRIFSRSWYDKYDVDDREPLLTLPAKKSGVKSSSVKHFLQLLRQKSALSGMKTYTTKALHSLRSEAGVVGCEEVIETLNMHGFLLKRAAGCYELIA